MLSINQQGGQTANTIINNLPPKRVISPSVESILINKLSKYRGKEYGIFLFNADQEAKELAKGLDQILVNSGWKKAGLIYNLVEEYPPGITIEIGWDPTEADQEFADLLLNLTDFKITANKVPNKKQMDIYIGPNTE